MDNEFSLKELYDVSIKTTQQIEVGSKVFEAGETIAQFDSIQLANFQEVRKIITANGGFENTPHVWWETVKDVQVTLKQGIFNKTQFAIMSNAKIFTPSSETIYLPKREILGLNSSNQLILKSAPYTPRFVYEKSTGNKITNYTVDDKVITITNPQSNEFIVDYYEANTNGYQVLELHDQISHTYFSLTGRTRVKDDVTGHTRTVIINIPQLKLMSDLSMRLGESATPVLGVVNALACPTPKREQKRVMEFIFLNDDIDSDI